MYKLMRRRVVSLAVVLLLCSAIVVFARRGETATALVYTQFSFEAPAPSYTYLDPFRGVSVEGQRLLHSQSGFRNPAPSPDRSQIVEARYAATGMQLYVVDVETQTARSLATNGRVMPMTTMMERNLLGTTLYAVWSPDGEWIGFLSEGDQLGLGLYIIRSDNSGLRRVAEYGEVWWLVEWVVLGV